MELISLEDAQKLTFRVPSMHGWKVKGQMWGTGARKRTVSSRKNPEGLWMVSMLLADTRNGRPVKIKGLQENVVWLEEQAKEFVGKMVEIGPIKRAQNPCARGC